jgi:hypothetical protein
VRRVLRAAERLLVRELVRLGQRDLAVAVAIGSAAQRCDEEVREERRADAIGFLRVFVFGARRQECKALDLVRRVLQKRRDLRAALDAREAPRGTAVDDRDVNIGGHRANALAQPRVVVARAADQNARFVRVTRVVDDELDALTLLALVFDALREIIERVVERLFVGLFELREVGLVHATELAQHVGDRRCVMPRIAQLLAAGATARVAADDERIATKRRLAARGCLRVRGLVRADCHRDDRGGDAGEEHRGRHGSPHGLFWGEGLRRRRDVWLIPLGSSSGAVARSDR